MLVAAAEVGREKQAILPLGPLTAIMIIPHLIGAADRNANVASHLVHGPIL